MPSITFFGVMLFVTQDEKVREVLFPHTGRPPREGKLEDGKWKHVDTSDARLHHPTLLFEVDKKADHRPLDGTKLSFEGGDTYLAKGDLAGFPDLGALPDGLSVVADPRARPVARISLALPKGFSKQLYAPAGWNFTMGGSGSPRANALVLTFEQPVSLVLENAVTGQERIELRGEDSAVIGHLDGYFQTTDELEDSLEKNKHATPPLRDIDFCWLYALVKPATGSFSDWCKPGKKLPAPIGTKGGDPYFLLPRVSTCFPGVI